MVSRRLKKYKTNEYLLYKSAVQKMLRQEQEKEQVTDNNANFFSFFSHGIQEKNIHNDRELINKYREYSEISEVEEAIDMISNEAVVVDEDNAVKILIKEKSDLLEDYVLDYLRDEIIKSFDRVYDILHYNVDGEMLFRRWYIDGRLYLYVDYQDGVGILNIYYLDPMRIKKIKKDDGELFYRYSFKKTADEKNYKFIDIPVSHIIFIDSGMVGKEGLIIGPLNKCIRPISSLKMMENSLVIARMSRAPERFIFKIDTKNLAKPMAEQYMRSLARNYRNKFYIDGTTGEIRGDTSSLAVMENFWFSKQEGDGHEVDILRGTTPMSDISDINYFYRKAIKHLNVPVGRFEEQKAFNFSSRKDEIDREELDFFKFVKKQRKRGIKPMFDNLIKIDLMMRGVIGILDWKKIQTIIKYVYNNDNKFEENKKYQELQSIFDMYPQTKQIVEDGYEDIRWFYEKTFNYTPDEVDEAIKRRKINLMRLAEERQMRIELGLQPKDDYSEDKQY